MTASAFLSVVTTVRNGAATLARTIESVRKQRIEGLEYIVVDGGSTDGTLDIVKSNADLITKWISEPDKGISDGFNKGISLATGRYVTLLNADDWLSAGQLEFGVETLEASGADFVFGDMLYHAPDGTALYKMRGAPDYYRTITHIMPALNHPTVILKREVYENAGVFQLNWRYAMDYELLLRFHRAGYRGVHDPRMIGHMTLDGASDRNSQAALREVRDIAVLHGYPAFPAHVRYCLRTLRGSGRRALESYLPRKASTSIRKIFNRSLSSAK